MELTVMFLVTCVITARIFHKKKMRIASAVYSVLFIAVLTILLFAADNLLIQSALANAIGAEPYKYVHEMLSEASQTTFYGISVAGVIGLTFAVQAVISLLAASQAVVKHFTPPPPNFDTGKITSIKSVLSALRASADA